MIIVLCVGAISAIKILNKSPAVDFSGAYSRTEGNPDADFQIVEYVDFQCPACAKGFKIISEYVKKYPDGIYVQMRYFPLTQSHYHALRTARYAECAARQGKFWPFVEEMFRRQKQWSQMINAEPVFRDIGERVNIDRQALDSCLNSEDVAKIILADKAKGSQLGIRSTPTYFINKKMIVGTKLLLEELTGHFSDE